jgi:hypothetical protein
VDLRRLRIGEWVAGVSGLVLLVSLFLNWYGPVVGDEKLSAWQSFAVTDVVLAVAAVWAISLALMTALDRSQAVPTAMSALLTYVALLALALLLYRVISPPGYLQSVTLGRPTGYIPSEDPSREIGLWIGLAATAGVLAGTLASLRDPRFPRAVREQTRVEVETLPTPPPEGAGGRSA